MNVFPGEGDLDADESFPFSAGDVHECQIRTGELKDLNKIGDFRIQDLDYFPKRSANPCGLHNPDEVNETVDDSRAVPDRVLELVLGWHAGVVDNHLDDTVLWIRPTMIGGLGLLQEITSMIVEFSLGALVLPFVCLYNAVFGGGCDPGDGFELAREYNPVDHLTGLIPGVGDIRSDKFTGLWHFMHVDAHIDRFNDVRGMWYPGAGVTHPGAVDVGISALTQTIGLSLNALSSQGDGKYGQYDEVSRRFPQWQAHTIGVLEWSPLHNLAHYGWDRFADDGASDASGLAWPLHAIGDAVVPHHVVATTSWGHRPFEDMVTEREDQLFFPRDRQAVVGQDPPHRQQLTNILLRGFHWWKKFRQGEDMEQFILDLARETRSAQKAQGDWAYLDGPSVTYLVNPSAAVNNYADAVLPVHESDIMRLLENGGGAALAMLTIASTKIPDVPRGDIDCPVGATFQVTSTGAGCVTTAPPTDPKPPHLGIDLGGDTTNRLPIIVQ